MRFVVAHAKLQVVVQVTLMRLLQFKTSLCEALLEEWEMQDMNPCNLLLALERLMICTLTYNTLRHLYVVCNDAK